MRRCGIIISSPLAAAAVILLLVAGCFHCAAAARLLPSSVPVPAMVHHENGVKAAAGAADGGLQVLQEGGVGNGDELSSIPEMMGADAAEEACEEGNDDDECMQRRLLHEAHLDYIYTQHKGKP
ncbi:hypothetical protein BDA96_08G038200 [Sorghum bicolor]|uniref:Phytosulfokine n=1 Tax=Sorghum bicolor TaxID=4558 RepID=A0A921QGM5_SORBI|nr:hypothetical protein BDA96_08G038200 [Sorghum bicolor]